MKAKQTFIYKANKKRDIVDAKHSSQQSTDVNRRQCKIRRKESTSVKCCVCDLSFPDSYDLFKHMQTIHFSSKPVITSQKKNNKSISDSKKRVYPKSNCEICNKEVCKAKLKRHYRIMHPDEDYVVERLNCNKKDKRPMKSCPICSKFTSERIDKHIQRRHKFSTQDPRYKELLLEARASKSKIQSNSLSKNVKTFYHSQKQISPIPQSNIDESLTRFNGWLQERGGGGKKPKDANQMTQQVKHICRVAVIKDTSEIATPCTFERIEKDFIDSSKQLKAATVQLYLNSFRYFSQCVMEHNQEHNHSLVAMKVSRWIASLKKKHNSESMERKVVNREFPLDTSLLAKYNTSGITDVVKSVGKILEGHSITQCDHGILREYIIMNILISNANRAGGILNITEDVFQKSKFKDGQYVFEIYCHKTDLQYGELPLVVTPEIFKYMEYYAKIFRPHILKMNSLQQCVPDRGLFLNWSGTCLTHSRIGDILTKALCKVGFSGRVSCNKIRHACVTLLYNLHHDTKLKEDIAFHMKNSVKTQAKHYNDQQIVSRAANTSQIIRKLLLNKEINISDIGTDMPSTGSKQSLEPMEDFDESGIDIADLASTVFNISDSDEQVGQGNTNADDDPENVVGVSGATAFHNASVAYEKEVGPLSCCIKSDVNLNKIVTVLKSSTLWGEWLSQTWKGNLESHWTSLKSTYPDVTPSKYLDEIKMMQIVAKVLPEDCNSQQEVRMGEIVNHYVAHCVMKKCTGDKEDDAVSTITSSEVCTLSTIPSNVVSASSTIPSSGVSASSPMPKPRRKSGFDEEQRQCIKNQFKGAIKQRRKVRVGEARQFLADHQGAAFLLFKKPYDQLSRFDFKKISDAASNYTNLKNM